MSEPKCLFCGKITFTPSRPNRQKKYCDNFCQNAHLKQLGIKVAKCNFSKQYLENLYIKEKKSVLDISRIIGKSIRQISRYLKFYKIPTRAFSTKGLQTRLGVVLSEETKTKIGLKAKERVKKGIYKSPGYIDGRTPKNKIIRESSDYKFWRNSVFRRDNWTCIWCKAKSTKNKKVYLNADHIKPFALFPELRFALSNGRTLCIDCHRKTNTFGGKSRYRKD